MPSCTVYVDTVGGAAPPDPLSRRTLADQIEDRLRKDILFGRIGAEERLTQEALCDRFRTSRIPVRDAIQRLTYDGLIEVTPGGLRVVAPAKQDFDDMFLIEGHLHGLASLLMMQRSTPGEIQSLVEINDRMHEAFEAHDYERVAETNGRFHRRINELAKSRQILRSLRANTARIDTEFLVHFPERIQKSIGEHDSFLKAVHAGDSDTAARIMRDHVVGSSEPLAEASQAEACQTGAPVSNNHT